MAKRPPLSDDALLLFALLVLIVVAVALYLVASALFWFILAVLSPLWETMGHWWLLLPSLRPSGL